MNTKKLMLLACMTLFAAWTSISIHQHSLEMASYNTPENTLKKYKSLDSGEVEKGNISNFDEIFGHNFYL